MKGGEGGDNNEWHAYTHRASKVIQSIATDCRMFGHINCMQNCLVRSWRRPTRLKLPVLSYYRLIDWLCYVYAHQYQFVRYHNVAMHLYNIRSFKSYCWDKGVRISSRMDWLNGWQGKSLRGLEMEWVSEKIKHSIPRRMSACIHLGRLELGGLGSCT